MILVWLFKNEEIEFSLEMIKGKWERGAPKIGSIIYKKRHKDEIIFQ